MSKIEIGDVVKIHKPNAIYGSFNYKMNGITGIVIGKKHGISFRGNSAYEVLTNENPYDIGPLWWAEHEIKKVEE